MSESKHDTHRLKAGDRLESSHVTLLNSALRMLRQRPGFECSGPICICSGDPDCNDMFGDGGPCHGDAYCDDTNPEPVCYCTRWGRACSR